MERQEKIPAHKAGHRFWVKGGSSGPNSEAFFRWKMPGKWKFPFKIWHAWFCPAFAVILPLPRRERAGAGVDFTPQNHPYPTLLPEAPEGLHNGGIVPPFGTGVYLNSLPDAQFRVPADAFGGVRRSGVMSPARRHRRVSGLPAAGIRSPRPCRWGRCRKRCPAGTAWAFPSSSSPGTPA